MTLCKKRLQKILNDNGIDSELLNELFSEGDPIKEAELQLKSERARIKYIEANLSGFVEPQTIYLTSKDDPIQKSYQYVDIKQTLKNLVEDPLYINQQVEDDYSHDPDVIKDIRDGSNYRNNRFFKSYPEALPLIIFQDEYEVCRIFICIFSSDINFLLRWPIHWVLGKLNTRLILL